VPHVVSGAVEVEISAGAWKCPGNVDMARRLVRAQVAACTNRGHLFGLSRAGHGSIAEA